MFGLLRFHSSDGKEQGHVVIKKSKVIIGRETVTDPSNSASVSSSSIKSEIYDSHQSVFLPDLLFKSVSREHAEINFNESPIDHQLITFTIKVLGRNGIFVNRVKHNHGEEIPVTIYDSIEQPKITAIALGKSCFAYLSPVKKRDANPLALPFSSWTETIQSIFYQSNNAQSMPLTLLEEKMALMYPEILSDPMKKKYMKQIVLRKPPFNLDEIANMVYLNATLGNTS
jgi:pSer/pThr/pTyr-binding forkhead associated (FHA) protein